MEESNAEQQLTTRWNDDIQVKFTAVEEERKKFDKSIWKLDFREVFLGRMYVEICVFV